MPKIASEKLFPIAWHASYIRINYGGYMSEISSIPSTKVFKRITNKNCKNCGIEFTTHLSFTVYCSPACHRKYGKIITMLSYHKNKKPKVKQYKRNCKICYNYFET